MATSGEIRIEEWGVELIPVSSACASGRVVAPHAALIEAEIDQLAEVLHAVVHAGASVSFFTPFSMEEARVFWVEKVLPDVGDGRRRVLVARLPEESRLELNQEPNEAEHLDRIVGTVQLELAMPPNQQHRAAVAKLLVQPDVRRRGIARALMIALEQIARSEGRSLLTLDTVSGSAGEFLYRSLGYTAAGIIPRYARAALTPALESTTIMYKELMDS